MSDTTCPRVALVTGGCGGIARAVVERLAGDGFAVAVHHTGCKDVADRLVEEITAAGGRAIAVGGDVADENAMTAVCDAVEAAFGGIDVLVRTAGVGRHAPLADPDPDPDDADRAYRTDGRGTAGADRQAARRLREGGAVIDFSMSETSIHVPSRHAYGAGGASTLILEPHGRDITVHAVPPGPTAASLLLEGRDGATAENGGEVAGAALPESLGRPEDIAETVALLAGPARSAGVRARVPTAASPARRPRPAPDHRTR